MPAQRSDPVEAHLPTCSTWWDRDKRESQRCGSRDPNPLAPQREPDKPRERHRDLRQQGKRPREELRDPRTTARSRRCCPSGLADGQQRRDPRARETKLEPTVGLGRSARIRGEYRKAPHRLRARTGGVPARHQYAWASTPTCLREDRRRSTAAMHVLAIQPTSVTRTALSCPGTPSSPLPPWEFPESQSEVWRTGRALSGQCVGWRSARAGRDQRVLGGGLGLGQGAAGQGRVQGLLGAGGEQLRGAAAAGGLPAAGGRHEARRSW